MQSVNVYVSVPHSHVIWLKNHNMTPKLVHHLMSTFINEFYFLNADVNSADDITEGSFLILPKIVFVAVQIVS